MSVLTVGVAKTILVMKIRLVDVHIHTLGLYKSKTYISMKIGDLHKNKITAYGILVATITNIKL